MWETTSIWFEISIISFFVAIGHIFFSHFEEQTPRYIKLVKFIATLIISISLSYFFGRTMFFVFLSVILFLVFYLHCIFLPSKGISGWTAKPKDKYYKLRNWNTEVNNNVKKHSK